MIFCPTCGHRLTAVDTQRMLDRLCDDTAGGRVLAMLRKYDSGVTRDALIAELGNQETVADQRGALRVTVSSLRRRLEMIGFSITSSYVGGHGRTVYRLEPLFQEPPTTTAD